MSNRMTPEQVAGLRLPEGAEVRISGLGTWGVYGSTNVEDPQERRMCVLIEFAANGHLPPAVLDWAWAHVDGRTVPTVEQWEAAERLAEMAVNKSSNDEALRIAAIILPPQPAPTPPPEPRPVVDVFATSRLRLPVVLAQEKDCDTCRYRFVHGGEEPCFSCESKPAPQPWTNWRPKP